MKRALFLIALLTASLAAQAQSSRPPFVTYAEARPVLSALAEVVPAELKSADETLRAAAWNAWVVRHDREVRDRLDRGNDDTMVNWLLFGTSFTNQPRALLDPLDSNSSPPSQPPSPTSSARLGELVAARTRDLIAALASPGTDERRLFARRLLEQKNYRFQTEDDRARVSQYLIGEVARVAREQEEYSRELQRARELGDASREFAARSQLFRTRGLSLDTSILPGFALEQSLEQMKTKGLLATGSIHRVAIIGPGLDFSDKSSGYDFYPQQTLQPFALIDSLLRLKLADATGIDLTTFDISPRVNDHLRRALSRAKAGSSYTLRVPLDLGLTWKPQVLSYWRRLGDQIGTEIQTLKPPEVGKKLEVRTIEVRPGIVLHVSAEDLDIVVQRFSRAPFDLVIATNVLVYYDTLDQSLALANIEPMLRPGGFLLSNNALLELPISQMRSAGYLTTQYSDRPDDGDHIVWYQRMR